MSDLPIAPSQIGRHTVILCHPDPHSFNHAVANAYRDAVVAAGQEVVLRDLYAIGFDPVLKSNERPTLPQPVCADDVAQELDLLSESDAVVLIYPIWFGSPPAMMKGYIERVLGAGVRPVDVHTRARRNLLGGKRLLSFTTAASTTAWLSSEGQTGALRALFDDYIVHAFGMHSQEHVRLSDITDDLSPSLAETRLQTGTLQAQRTCALVVSRDQFEIA